VFLVDKASTTGGRKTVVKPIMHSDRQSIEDIGLQQPTFTLNGVVAERVAPNGTELQSYANMRKSLVEALNESGTGVLVHPWDGRVENLQVLNWTLSDEMTSLGQAKLAVTFGVSNADGLPQVAAPTLDEVVAAATVAEAAATDAVDTLTEVSEIFSGNFQDLADAVDEALDGIQQATEPLVRIASEIDSYTKELADLAANVVDLVNDPTELAESIQNLMTSAKALFATPRAVFDAMKRMFDIGDDDPERPPASRATSGSNEKHKNRELLRTQVQTIALASAYVAAAEFEFTSVEEIIEVQDILETQFQKMTADAIWENDVEEGLANTRVASTEVFEAQRAVRPRETTVRVNQIPARVLAHSYYEDSTRGEQIALLNGARDAAFLEGDVTVLTS
jgi:prophage DNA circulation protein